MPAAREGPKPMNAPGTDSSELAVVILAAGKGTRMKSDLPKVLHPLAGRPLLGHVLALADALGASRKVAVIGYQAQLVRQAFAARGDLLYAVQEPQLGTGHAMMAAAPALAGFAGRVLVLYGDVPCLRAETCRRLLAEHDRQGNAMTVLAMELERPGAYGRLIAGADGRLRAIVEARDASPAQLAVRLVNSGIYVFEAAALLGNLAAIRPDNDQQEYYLTDMAGILGGLGLAVGYVICPDPDEVAGVNSKDELAQLEARLAAGRGAVGA